MVGKASWYGQDFHGNKTASGHRYDMYTFTAAHRTLPFGTVVKVTSREEGKSVMVRVNDRGPYVRGRIIDLSFAAADQLGLADKGVGDVKLEIVSDPQGNPLRKGQAYFVQYKNGHNKRKSGPYHAFEVAAARQRELQSRHPDAVVVLDDTDK
ncbi:MAG: septal ring lytic transglycosylase RlpA family protein [Desulfovibrio sp.]|nr:septal ring lytic transglycosylase RlpA family protein [Desulfovibrio sp.]MBR4741290.1 septal ring lytic transglycosylase RlpA family protein [Desulfovibrio sp.]